MTYHPESIYLVRNIRLLIGIVSFGLGSTVPSGGQGVEASTHESIASSKTETFTFPSNGKSVRGKVFLPASYEENKYLPAIFLVDFTEQHFKVATDEFEKVVEGVQQLEGPGALVVTLEDIPDVDAEPASFHEEYEIFKDMALYVDSKYTTNPSRTFIGKGSESGIVMMALFQEYSEQSVFDNFIATDPSGPYATAIIEMLEKGRPLEINSHKKLHFSFSTSNDRERCSKLINLINESQFPWLEFESTEYTDSNYENTYPLSYAEGLKFVFADSQNLANP